MKLQNTKPTVCTRTVPEQMLWKLYVTSTLELWKSVDFMTMSLTSCLTKRSLSVVCNEICFSNLLSTLFLGQRKNRSIGDGWQKIVKLNWFQICNSSRTARMNLFTNCFMRHRALVLSTTSGWSRPGSTTANVILLRAQNAIWLIRFLFLYNVFAKFLTSI